MVHGSINSPVELRILAADGNESLFGRFHIYNDAGTLVSNLSASHIAEGLYGVSWTPTIEGSYSLVGQFFIDALFTIDAGYEKQAEEIDVNSLRENVIRLLGLSHENVVIDQQTYDVDSNLIGARVRTYDSKTNAQAATSTGIVAIYTVVASYSGGELSQYSMVRDV